ncbi:DUF3023 domain-containing protein [Ehrlichia chaffeensis]|uniref:DUF3023 domain-containing protein n=1 Tax=Ehrlichia chaffeensis TaxID=945 RepID=UPI000444ECC9|nr:DUF3023 domain-containing protein [Ehrlichia chaffeensis]AHX09482.1 hypothetical protein ECHWAK_0436 [Ehrlichia chaffeensis str. Wakulla]
MLGEICLTDKIKFNTLLQEKLLTLDCVQLQAVYPIGITDSKGRLIVQSTKTHRRRKLPLPGPRSNLFLLRCRLPAAAVEDDEELRGLLGEPGILTAYYNISVYYMVHSKNLDPFLLHAASNMSLCRKNFVGLGNYGGIVIVRGHGTKYDEDFSEERDLVQIGGLSNVKFLSEEDFTKYFEVEQAEVEQAAAQQEVSGADVVSESSGSGQDKDKLAAEVMTQLMGLSIEGIESQFPEKHK